MPRFPHFPPPSTLLLLGAAALCLGALACGSGSGAGGGGAGGAGGRGGDGWTLPPMEGSCAEPLDFDEHSLEMGSTPFVSGELDVGHETLQSPDCGGKGKERVYSWTAPRDGRLRLRRINVVDHVTIYVRTSCAEPSSELGCVRTDPVEFEVRGGEELFFIVDSEQGSPSYDFALLLFPTDLQEGERCGDGIGSCSPGLSCSVKSGSCATPIPPALEEGLAHHYGERLLIRVWAHAPQGNIVAMIYRFLDEEGELTTEELYLDTKEYSYGQIEFMGGHALGLSTAAGAAAVEVQLVNDAGQRSDPIELPIVPAPIVGVDEECDPEHFLGTCAEGLDCDIDQRPPRCAAPEEE